MAEIILVRHGQANSQADTEESYDRLSDVGHQQARWLGEYFDATNPHFDHVVCGDMRRHKETAAGIGHTETHIDARWNEISYFALADALERKRGIPHPGPGGDFVTHVDHVFTEWRAGALDQLPESYAEFDTRVTSALEGLVAKGGRSLVVTSTGVIAMVMRHILDLSHKGHMKMIVQTANTSVHRVEYLRGAFYIGGFGATPHLDAPDRAAWRTHY